MAVDAIKFRYRGTMRGWNGNLFQVDWAGVPDDTPLLDLATPFRSGIGGELGPFDVGWIGEIPTSFPPKSRAVVPARVCDNCFLGGPAFWETGWPPGTPGVILGPDGWPIGCSEEEQVNSCLCDFDFFDESTGYIQSVSSCYCDSDNAETSTGSEADVDSCVADCDIASFANGPNYTVSSCFADCETVQEMPSPVQPVTSCVSDCDNVAARTGFATSVLSCASDCDSFVGIPFVPLLTYGCANYTAAGTNQGTATVLGDDNCYVNAGSGGVILPSGCYRIYVLVEIAGLGNINVYPPVGETLLSQGIANRPRSLNQNGGYALFTRFDGGIWVDNANF